MIKLKKYAFTLAEVLITIGIVGVVATITIPTLMNNYQKKNWESGLKKAYGTVTNACQAMLNDENTNTILQTDFYRALDTNSINTNSIAKKYFKTIKDGEYKSISNLYDPTGGAPRNQNESIKYELGKTPFVIYLPDSSVLYAQTDIIDDSSLYFLVDINGPKNKPNRVGADLFGIILDENCDFKGEYSACSKEQAQAQGQNFAGSSAATAFSCGTQVIENNWEINYKF